MKSEHAVVGHDVGRLPKTPKKKKNVDLMVRMVWHSRRMTVGPGTLIRRCGSCHFSAATRGTKTINDDDDFAAVVAAVVEFVLSRSKCDPDRFRNLRRGIELD